MNIQSFSIVVPNKECMNKCPYCVSRMVNSNIYPNLMDVNHPTYDYNVKEYMRRMKYVADNGCQTLMLTGTSEPQQNKQFLNTFALVYRLLGKPFTNIEMQTTGVLLDKNPDYLRFLKNFVCVNTMAISLSSLSTEMNSSIIGNNVDVIKLCHMLKDYGFNSIDQSYSGSCRGKSLSSAGAFMLQQQRPLSAFPGGNSGRESGIGGSGIGLAGGGVRRHHGTGMI